MDVSFTRVPPTMSEDSLQFDPHALRRTLSTGDIPSRGNGGNGGGGGVNGVNGGESTVPRPQRARISVGGASTSSTPHPLRYHNHTDPPPIEHPLPTITEHPQPYRTWYGRMMGFFGYGRRASKARRELVSLIWNLSWGFVQVSLPQIRI